MKYVEVVAGVIVNASKILCVRRGDNSFSYLAYKWEFPGGKIEPNESESNALVRELQEELHVDITIGEKIMTVNHHYPDFHLTLHAYFCISETNSIILTEHTAYEWCHPGTLRKFDWLEADFPIIDKLIGMTV